MERLSQGELDLAIVALPVGESVGPSSRAVTTVELRRERFVLVAPPGHELAVADTAGWDDLEGKPFVDFSPAWLARQIVDDAFTGRRRTRQTVMTVDDVHMLLGLVTRGFGIAMLPESMAVKPEAAGLMRLALADPEPVWQVHVATADRAGVATRALAATLIGAPAVAELRDDVAAAA